MSEAQAPVISLDALAALQAQAVETGVNMTEEQKGGGGRKLLPEGVALGRICGYVERGKQPQEFNGQAKDPADEIQLSFELHGPGISNDDGTAYVDHGMPFAVHRNTKAGAFKNFAILNWDGLATHWLQLVGKAFLFKIVRKKSAATGKEYSYIDLSKTLPPMDQLTKAPYNVPPLDPKNLRVFLFDNPQLAHWDSLKFGEHTFLQDDILRAKNFPGSALETLLASNGRTTTPAPKKAAVAKPSESGIAGPGAGVAAASIAAPAADVPASSAGADAAAVAAINPPFDGGTLVQQPQGTVATPAMPGMMDA